ncbi:helix-turn-helix domain-containing protein [Pseudomonas sp. LRF_L74]|uniref:helix-turn-helix domain-containing protein n=1 Tax=Pseudomonas sp. LRF_L74 TaxID=3369422 RepID=UPI003F633A2A
MPAHALLETRRASTGDVPQDQRLAFWEHYNRSLLVGLRCSSYVPSGLSASQDNLFLDHLSVARIEGNEHVVERDCSIIRSAPKESVFVSLVLDSESFFFQGGGCRQLRPGELVIYRTDSPYLMGFSGPTRHFVFDLPQAHFAYRCLRDFKEPLQVSAALPVQRLLMRTLGQRTQAFFQSPRRDDAQRFEDEAYELLASIIGEQAGEHRGSALGRTYLLMARQFIHDHLGDASLDIERIAAAAGISRRHLTRLFAQDGDSLNRYIQALRLEHARQLLGSPAGRRLDIAEVAYRHGFSSQSHFARAFKARYGMTASEARQAGD